LLKKLAMIKKQEMFFLVLSIVACLLPQRAHGGIEIYADGHQYNSLQAYQLSKKTAVTPSMHQLYVLSVENGVKGALQDFYETRRAAVAPWAHKISSGELQGAIAQAVTASNGPKLLISQPGRVRVMDLKKLDS